MVKLLDIKWLDIVKKHAKLNPRKSLRDYLPKAKVEWDQLKKSGQVVVASASKTVKSIKGGGKRQNKKSKSNDLSYVSQDQNAQAAALVAASIIPLARGRGRSKSRNGGKGKNGKTRKIAGRGRSKSRSKGKSRSRSRAGKGGKGKKSGSFDITSTNLK